MSSVDVNGASSSRDKGFPRAGSADRMQGRERARQEYGSRLRSYDRDGREDRADINGGHAEARISLNALVSPERGRKGGHVHSHSTTNGSSRTAGSSAQRSLSVSPISTRSPHFSFDQADSSKAPQEERRRQPAVLAPVSPGPTHASFKYPMPLTPTRARQQRLERARSRNEDFTPISRDVSDTDDADRRIEPVRSASRDGDERGRPLERSSSRDRERERDRDRERERERDRDWRARKDGGLPRSSSGDMPRDLVTTDSAATSDQSRKTHDSNGDLEPERIRTSRPQVEQQDDDSKYARRRNGSAEDIRNMDIKEKAALSQIGQDLSKSKEEVSPMEQRRRDTVKNLPVAPTVGAVVKVYDEDDESWERRSSRERAEPDRDYSDRGDARGDRSRERERGRDRRSGEPGHPSGAQRTSRGNLRALHNDHDSPAQTPAYSELSEAQSPVSTTAPSLQGHRSRYSLGPGDYDPYQASGHSRSRTNDSFSAMSSGWVSLTEDDEEEFRPHSSSVMKGKARNDPRALKKEVHRLSKELYELRHMHRQGLNDLERTRRRAEEEWLGRVGALERRLIDEQMRRASIEEHLHYVTIHGGGSVGLLSAEELEHERAARDRAEAAAVEVHAAWEEVALSRKRASAVRDNITASFESLFASASPADMELMVELTPAVASEAHIDSRGRRLSHSRAASTVSGISTPIVSARGAAGAAEEEDADVDRERAIERAKRRERKRAKLKREMAQEYQNQLGKKTLVINHSKSGKPKMSIKEKLARSRTLQPASSDAQRGLGRREAADDSGLRPHVAKNDSSDEQVVEKGPVDIGNGRRRSATVNMAAAGSIPLDIPRPKTKPTGAPDKEALALEAKEREKAAMRKAANHLRKEIMIAEQKYADALHVLLNYYVRPIMNDAKKLGIKAEQLKKLFSNVESIANFHQILHIDMRDEDLAQVFLKNAPFLRMYSEYVATYDVSLDLLDSMRENKTFQDFLTKTRSHPDVGGLKLTDLLIMPVQRIPLYEVLLEKLLEKTDPDDPSYGSLITALQTVQTIVLEVNEKKRYGENLTSLLRRDKELAKLVRGLLRPTRVVVRHGEIHVVKKKMKKPYLFILFNDALIWTSASSFRYKGIIHMASVLVEDGAPAEPMELILRDTLKKSSVVVLRFESAKEKIGWFESLNACIAQATQRSGKDDSNAIRSSTMTDFKRDPRQNRTLPRSMTIQAPGTLSNSGSGNIQLLQRSSTLAGMSALSLHSLVPPSQAEVRQQKANLLMQAGIKMTPEPTPHGTPQPTTPMESSVVRTSQDDAGLNRKIPESDDDVVPPPPRSLSHDITSEHSRREEKMALEEEDGSGGEPESLTRAESQRSVRSGSSKSSRSKGEPSVTNRKS